MSAPHFFVAGMDGEVVRIAGEDGRHAARVLRIRPDEAITVSDGRGTIAEALVEGVGGSELTARLVAVRTVAPARPRVALYPAVPKSGKLDLVVQKATEVGVDSIRPWFAARSVVRWDARKAGEHGRRWRAIAREAAQQSRRAWLPEVADPAPIAELPPVAVVLHQEAAQRLLDLLPADPPEEIGAVVGPEGGLTEDEIAGLVRLGALLAGLGPQVLRTETAGILVPALVLSRYRALG